MARDGAVVPKWLAEMFLILKSGVGSRYEDIAERATVTGIAPSHLVVAAFHVEYVFHGTFVGGFRFAQPACTIQGVELRDRESVRLGFQPCAGLGDQRCMYLVSCDTADVYGSLFPFEIDLQFPAGPFRQLGRDRTVYPANLSY